MALTSSDSDSLVESVKKGTFSLFGFVDFDRASNHGDVLALSLVCDARPRPWTNYIVR